MSAESSVVVEDSVLTERIAMSLLLPYINESPIRIILYYNITLKNRISSQKFSRDSFNAYFL